MFKPPPKFLSYGLLLGTGTLVFLVAIFYINEHTRVVLFPGIADLLPQETVVLLALILSLGFLVVMGYCLWLKLCVAREIRRLNELNRELAESEFRYRSMLRYAPVGITVRDSEGKLLFANPRFEQFIGYSETELREMSLQEITHPEDIAQTVTQFTELVTSQRTLMSLSKRYFTSKQEVRWAHTIAFPVYDADGNFLYSIGMIEDLTDAKRAERALRETEERFQMIVAASPMAIIVVSGEGRYLYVNPQFERLLGYQLADLKHPTHPNQEVAARTLLQNVSQSHSKLVQFESRYTRADGSEVNCKTHAVEIRDSTGNFMYAVGMVEDITESKRAEEQLRFHGRVLSQVSDAVVAIDNDRLVTYWNKAAEALYGYQAEEVLGKPLDSTVCYEWISEEMRELSHQALSAGRSWRGEKIHVRKGGERLYVDSSISRLRDYEGRFVGTLSVMRDITERKRTEAELLKKTNEILADISAKKRAEEELIKAKEAAEAANREKTSFLANMSHEIRTPLGSILGFSEMLLEAGLQETECKSYAQIIRRNGRHLLALIDDMLDLSRIEAGVFNVEILPMYPMTEIQEAVTLLEKSAQQKGLEIVVVYEGDIPEKIRSDPRRFRQVLINLMGNAIKFSDKGGVVLRVRLTHDSGNEPVLELLVEDTGIGISESVRENLFHPFSQADSSMGRKYGGTGLGLALSKKIASELGGDLTLVRSTAKVGSVFSFRVKTGCLDDVMMCSETSRAEVKSSQGETSLQGTRVLLVEDILDNQILIRHILERSGAEVTCCSRGQDGIGLAFALEPDVVLMDIQMPGLDGYQATHTLRSRGYSGPIVALTAHAMQGERKRCLSVGCDDYLSKPVEPELLVQTVAKYGKVGQQAVEGPLASIYEKDPRVFPVLNYFIGALPGTLESIENALRDRDQAKLLSLVHQLKGSSGGYGYPDLVSLSKKIEQGLGQTGDLTQVSHLVKELVAVGKRAIRGYKRDGEDAASLLLRPSLL